MVPGIKWGYAQRMTRNAESAHGHYFHFVYGCSAKWSIPQLQIHDWLFLRVSLWFLVSLLFISAGIKVTCVHYDSMEVAVINTKEQLKSQVHPQFHHDCILAICKMWKSTSLLGHNQTISAGGSRFSLISATRWPFFLLYRSPEKGHCHFMSLLAIKMQGLCQIPRWRTTFAITECHVYPLIWSYTWSTFWSAGSVDWVLFYAGWAQ